MTVWLVEIFNQKLDQWQPIGRIKQTKAGAIEELVVYLDTTPASQLRIGEYRRVSITLPK